MNGVDDQAEAGVRKNLDELYSHETVQIKYSSRNLVVSRLCDVLENPTMYLVARKLVFRSGISVEGMVLLRETLTRLQRKQGSTVVHELEFVCLSTADLVQAVIMCCRESGIKRLSLRNFMGPSRRDCKAVSEAIRLGMTGVAMRLERNSDDNSVPVDLEYLELGNYPIGADGIVVLSNAIASLVTLKLVDCDVRSDCANTLADIIRENPKLETLDLSYNRHYLGSPLTREMTVKTLVQKGLKQNITLTQLIMKTHDGSSNSHCTMDLSQIVTQLEINRFIRKHLINDRCDVVAIPAPTWPLLLNRVSSKPAALYLILRQGITTLYS